MAKNWNVEMIILKLKVISSGSQYGNCYAIIAGSEILLLDCGCRYSDILKGIEYKITNAVGCLLTHEHGDHSKSYKEILKAGIPIYTNDETADSLEIITGERMIGKQEKRPFMAGNFVITPFYVPHDGTPNYAYIVRLPDGGILLYATDFLYLPYKFQKMRINHFLIECNHMDESPDENSMKYNHSICGHSRLSEVKKIIDINKSSSLRNVILCHLSETWGNPEIMQNEVQSIIPDTNVLIADPGIEIDLKLEPF